MIDSSHKNINQNVPEKYVDQTEKNIHLVPNQDMLLRLISKGEKSTPRQTNIMFNMYKHSEPTQQYQ